MSARTVNWTLNRLLTPWGVSTATVGDDIRIGGLTLDSRAVKPNDLFLACAGLSRHGLDYAEEAVRRGAAAVAFDPAQGRSQLPDLSVPLVPIPDLAGQASALADQFYGTPSTSMRVIGITGTNGKTSCAHLLAQTLDDPPGAAAILGTLGNGRPGHLVPSSHTTLDAVSVQAWLAHITAIR
ncbi:MAG TPA: UDP-N-acetylmuramoylalanyl-D-glutamate--2,6-diaminopimelate ligase, partial [Gammaproteobacteria bacterium]|nr:UDP-N-acetylmuramoylalanyl-D-glutamate--2,6-diaminopimelate ligase [Gammaproteobacteria bacterium]